MRALARPQMMNKPVSITRRVVLVGLWLGSLALAFIWGADRTEKPFIEPMPVAASSAPKSEPNTPAMAAPEVAMPSAPATDFSLERFDTLWSSGPADLYYDPELYLFLNDIPIEQIPALADHILTKRRVGAHRSGQMLWLLYRRWAEADIDAAMQSVYNLPINDITDDAYGAVLQVYAEADPEAAFDYYLENIHGQKFLSNRAGAAVVKQLTLHDPKRALAEIPHLVETDPDNEGWYTNEFARGVIANHSLEYGAQLLASMEDEALRHKLIDCLFHGHAFRHDPATTAASLEQIENPSDRRAATLALARAWGSLGPEQGMDWALSLPKPELRAEAVDAAMLTWITLGNAAKAAEWLNSQPVDPVLDSSIERLIQFTMQHGNEAESAFTWALGLSDQSERRVGDAAWTLEKWMEQGGNPDEARRLIDESALSDLEKLNLRQTLRDSEKKR